MNLNYVMAAVVGIVVGPRVITLIKNIVSVLVGPRLAEVVSDLLDAIVGE